MIIDSYDINMAAMHLLSEKHEKSEELRIWVDSEGRQADSVTLSDQARNQNISAETEIDELSPAQSGKIFMLKMLVEAMIGRKIDLKELRNYSSDATPIEISDDIEKADAKNQQSVREGWGIIYNSTESHHEQETLSFGAVGTIRTEDGRDIEVSLQLDMNREFKSQETINFRAGDALIDPLVINFAGSAANLSAPKFSFDLDVDGKEDYISFVTPGSGLLSLDHNNDGTINDGSELFGPQTGNGFNELSQYDNDGNNWIDENDTVYGRLKIWTKDAEGNDYLHTLKDKGVGAIYLNNLETEFSLKDSRNSLNGQIARTGIFLHEDGSVGTVQQIDIVA